jgi:hypothetical protein
MGIFIPEKHPKTKDALSAPVPEGSARNLYTVRCERKGLNVMRYVVPNLETADNCY